MSASTLYDSVPPVMASRKPDRSFDPARWAGFDLVRKRASQRVILVPQAHAQRAQTEAFIRDVYEQVFGARGLEFPSMLIALLGGDDRLLCAAGLRTAGEGFFSEAYLDAPIEDVLCARLRKPVVREAVFEVNTLASQKVEVSPVFLRQIAELGRRAGFEWCFFTAGIRLRKLLRHLDIPILELDPADPRRLANPERWGTYYRHSPRVCAVEGRWLDGGEPPQEDVPPHA